MRDRLAVGGAAEKKNVIASSAWERYRTRKLLIVPSSATKKAEHGRHGDDGPAAELDHIICYPHRRPVRLANSGVFRY
jgi:hypothetical protein